MSIDRDVAIIGMACVFPKAPNLKRYWYNLANGVDGIQDRPPRRWREHVNFTLPGEHEAYLPCSRAGYLDDEVLFDPAPYGVLPNLVRHGDPDQFLMLRVIDEALRDAEIGGDAPVRRRTDVLIGRGGYATGKLVELTLRAEMFETVLELLARRFPDLRGPRRLEMEKYLRSTLTPRALDNVSTAVSNITASRTANRLNLHGSAYIVDGACASSLLAVEEAMWRLRNRQCDLAIGAGIFLSLSPTFLYVFHQLGALSPSQQIRPFDRRADGLLPGEGGGAVVLKRLEDALRDGDRVYAVLKGAASASDGKDVDVLAPSSGGQIRALERAYGDAGIDPASVGYLELHGTGTVVGDEVELASVKAFFGASPQPPTSRAMGSVKSMIGHTMPAAGIAALIKTALSLSNKVLIPSLHCEEPREELLDAPFYLNTQTRPWIHNPSLGPRRAGVNAFGFGGINAHLVLEETPKGSPERRVRARPIEPGVRRPSELVVFSAADPAALSERLKRVVSFLEKDQCLSAAHADRPDGPLADVAWSALSEFDGDEPAKLAVIAGDVDELREKLVALEEQLRTHGEAAPSETVYYSRAAAGYEGKIAFVMPGMGFPGLIGNYPDHLLELCLHYPEVREEFDFFEDRDRHPQDTVPTSSIFVPPASLPEEYRTKLKARLAPPKVDQAAYTQQLPEERYLAAMGVTLSNWVGWVLLSKFQIPVDMITGQSQGEMAALCAAGVGDFHASARHFWKVLNVDARDDSGGRLAFAWTSAEKIQPLLDDNPGTYMAIYMAPEGLIFGGDREGLLRIAERLRAERVLVQLLPYPPIHTPTLSHLREELLDHLGDENMDIQPPRIPIYSSITTERYPSDPEGVRETLMLNVDQPLRIWQTIRRMYEDGARIFVQVGGGHMAAHLERLLPEGSTSRTAALDVDTRDPITQLHHLCATLVTAGVPMRLEPLFEHRSVQRLDFDAPRAAPPRSRMATPLRIDWTPLYSENAPPRPEPVPPTTDFEPAATVFPEVTETTSPSVAEPAAAAEEPSPVFEFPADLPVLGTVTSFVPEQSIVIQRWLDLAEDLFLADHLFVHAECKPLSERLPILPLTMSIEFLAEAAALLAPGLGLVGFEKIRGVRWIGLEDADAVDLTIEASLESIDPETGVRRIKGCYYVDGKLSFQGTALYADSYRSDLAFDLRGAEGTDAWWLSNEQVYGERFMFHGPAFHVTASLDAIGPRGGLAHLRVRPTDRLFASRPEPLLLTDPCLMDGIGQIVGLWSMAYGECILPTGAEKIEIYRPTPPVGTLAPIRIEVLELNPQTKQIRCNIEIEDGAGNVWVRVADWSEWVLRWTQQYSDATRLPNTYLIAAELELPGLPAGSTATMLRRSDFRGVDFDWAARIFLHSVEMPEYWAIGDARKRKEMVVARACAKDAARLWWTRRHGGAYPHPAELAIGHDEMGAPCLLPAGDPAWPRISIAHTEQTAVAVASDDPVGVDLEPRTREVRSILSHFASEAELELLRGLSTADPAEAWELRLWCAKESAGKALGIGLAGRPKDLVLLDAEPDGAMLLQHEPTGERLLVRTVVLEDHVIGYASREAAAAAPPMAAELAPEAT